MTNYVKRSRHPLSSITNHGLINLLVQISFARHNLRWDQFVAIFGVHWELAVGHIEEREVKRSSPGLAGGGGEELEEGGDDQEEDSGGVAVAVNPI